MEIFDAKFTAWRGSVRLVNMSRKIKALNGTYKSVSGEYRSMRAGAFRGPRVGRRAWEPSVAGSEVDSQ